MKYLFRTLLVCTLSIALFSCKNEVKETPVKTEITPVKKKELSVQESEIVSSILAKAMATKEAKKFVSFMLTAGVTDMLSKDEGPYTLLIPTNDAIDKVNKNIMTSLLNPANKADLLNLVNSHIIKGELDSAALVQNIKKGNGKYEFTTLSGATYTATRDDIDIVITDVRGQKAILGKTDILGSNGILHLMNSVLSVN
ncbi:fasciclin domain-containing protein [Ulvibacter antarcticus]|uniref:Putative surface protein with fasciclin (FAS1) repeats n=1 Tax=Ulvibacter antarcticus TaxID=442714 RepID=A0A3L9YFB8_9FLAO|nr:fasciclin domain-containing protein [Ulvibacter antarcticus]RMA57819.1 putative surface protein with fasciclin (FAS1) repeats [Ulvibacter antarcticus]